MRVEVSADQKRLTSMDSSKTPDIRLSVIVNIRQGHVLPVMRRNKLQPHCMWY